MQPKRHWLEGGNCSEAGGMQAGSIPLSRNENRSRAKTLLCGLQSIFTAPSPWWKYTFAHQIPSTNTHNQHQPRHRFWRDNPQVQPKRHWFEGWNCSEAGECRQATKKADKRQLFLSIKFYEVISLPAPLQFCTP